MMNDRVESAERLLSTVLVGQAHVRALALRHLPAGRALAIELAAIASLSASNAGHSQRSDDLQEDPSSETVSTARTAAEDLPSDPAWARIPGAPEAAADNEDTHSATALAPSDEASNESPARPRRLDSDEDTSDNETDPGAAIRAAEMREPESSHPASAAPADASSRAEEPPTAGSQTVIEENDDEEQTIILSSSELFDDPLDPMAGWSSDDGVAPEADAGADDMHWGDMPRTVADPFIAAAAVEPSSSKTSSPDTDHDDDDQEATRIIGVDDDLQAALEDAEPIEEALGEDFELSAEELHWGDTYGNLHDSVETDFSDFPEDTKGEQADHLNAGDDSQSQAAVNEGDPSELHWADSETGSRFAEPLPIFEGAEDSSAIEAAEDPIQAIAAAAPDTPVPAEPEWTPDEPSEGGAVAAVDWNDDYAPDPNEFDDDP
ncbi:MAG TPA: hypothetical protein DFR83_07410, partial [Deltaproteobacteria bacterium]|nr:hypothetical protein [Deltaproteobacteria bacterium]